MISFLWGVLEVVAKKGGVLRKGRGFGVCYERYLKFLQGKAMVVTVWNQSISYVVPRLISYETSLH